MFAESLSTWGWHLRSFIEWKYLSCLWWKQQKLHVEISEKWQEALFALLCFVHLEVYLYSFKISFNIFLTGIEQMSNEKQLASLLKTWEVAARKSFCKSFV